MSKPRFHPAPNSRRTRFLVWILAQGVRVVYADWDILGPLLLLAELLYIISAHYLWPQSFLVFVMLGLSLWGALLIWLLLAVRHQGWVRHIRQKRS